MLKLNKPAAALAAALTVAAGEATAQEPVDLDAAPDNYSRFTCGVAEVGNPASRLDFIVTRSFDFADNEAPELNDFMLSIGRGILGLGMLEGNNAASPALVARCCGLFERGGLVFVEAPGAGASLLTINPEKPAGAQAGTFTADYVRHMNGLVSNYRGRCTAIGGLWTP